MLVQEVVQILLLEAVVEQHQEEVGKHHDSVAGTYCSAAVVGLAEEENPVLAVEGNHSLLCTI